VLSQTAAEKAVSATKRRKGRKIFDVISLKPKKNHLPKLLAGRKKTCRFCSKGDKSKVALARRLRQETTMSLKWIAQRLHTGQLDLRFQPIL